MMDGSLSLDNPDQHPQKKTRMLDEAIGRIKSKVMHLDPEAFDPKDTIYTIIISERYMQLTDANHTALG